MYEGWAAGDWNPEYEEAREEFSFGFLARKYFRDYLTDDFWRAFFIWRRCRRRGLPSGGGWNEEPEALLDMLDLFDDTLDRLERAKARAQKAKEEIRHGRAGCHK